MLLCLCFFFFKQKTAYEMRISDWSSDVCSSDLVGAAGSLGAITAALVLLWRHKRASAQGLGWVLRATERLPRRFETRARALAQIGRASCRERVCQYV